MKRKIIKTTGFLLLFFFITATKLFAGFSVDITGSMSAGGIGINIQNAIAGATAGDTVTITGSNTDGDGKVELNIPAGITVAWKAASKGLYFDITGSGTFEVAESGKIEVTGGKAVQSATGNVIVSGGEVSATGFDCFAIFVDNGNVTVFDGMVSADGDYSSAIEINTGNVIVAGGMVLADGDYGHDCYAICVNTSGTVMVTGGNVLATHTYGSPYDIYMGAGLAAFLKGTCNDQFVVWGNGIIVEVESLDIPSSYGGTNNGLTRKYGNAISTIKWDTSGDKPVLDFSNGTFTIEWAVPSTDPVTPPVIPAEHPVRLTETGTFFDTLNEAIAAAKGLGHNTFTLEVIGNVTETSNVIIGSEDITIVGAEGKHTFAFASPPPPSGFKFSVQGGGSLTLGNGTETSLLTILHSVRVTDGEIIVNDGVKLNGGLYLSGTTATGSITGGRFEGQTALSIEKGATLSEISGGVFTGATDAVHLSDTGTRIELISGGVFYQKGTYIEIGKLHGHGVFVQNGSTIGEISGGYFEATANCAMIILRGAWVDKISGGEFVAVRPGTTREPGDDQWNSVIHVETRVSEGYSLSGIGTISDGHFHGGAHFGMLLITNGTGTAKVNEITGGFFEGVVGVQNDVGGHIGTISGGKIYGDQGILSNSTIDKITGDADIHGSSSYGIFNYSNGLIGEISGGKITSNNSHGLQNSGVIGTISDGTITSIKGISNGINNSSQIDKITGGIITSEQYGNGISNSGKINEISGGKITGGLGTAPMFTGDTSGNGIYNSDSIILISGGTVIGYKNAINCVGYGDGGSIHTISNGVFRGQTKLAINLAKTVLLEPDLDAVIGFGRYWGNDGVIFNNEDLVEYPGDYFMSAKTKSVEGITEVEFKYLRLMPECLDSLVWTGAINKDWNNNGNWVNPDATVAGYAPRTCTNVLIPKGLSIYPDLTSITGTDYTQEFYEIAACNNIWFEHGGEVVRTDLLNYQKSNVELTLAADRWNMLSAPLRYMFPGDYYQTFACPHEDELRIYQQLFAMKNPQTGEADTSPTGDWTKPFNDPDVAMPAGFGYAISLQDKSDYPSESHWTPLPKGERHSIWLPKDDESYNIYYIASCNIYDTRPLERNKPLNYRFIYEGGNGFGTDNWTGDITLTTAGTSGEGKQVIVGNPFMSHWNFNDFYLQNSDKIKEEYKVLEGDNDAAFVTYSPLLPSWSSDKLVAPMQSVLVTSLNSFNKTELKTRVTSMAQNPGNILKSAVNEQSDLLKVIVSKDGQQNHSHILFDESASNNYLLNEDSYKLFVTGVTEPVSVYTRSSDNYALDINVFGDCSQIIPIGVRTSQTGTINLQFEGIENFLPGTGVFLVDAQNGMEIYLRETTGYSFEKKTSDLFLDGRFYLSFKKGPNSDLLPTQSAISVFATGNQLQVISNNAEIDEVQVFDMQGRLLHRATNIGGSVYTHDLGSDGMYVVKVITEGSTIVKKITTAK